LKLSAQELPSAINALFEAKSKLEVMLSCNMTLAKANPDFSGNRPRSTTSTRKLPPTSPRG
jgi:hypothetical protein